MSLLNLCSRRNQHYHSQRSVSSRKIDYHMTGPPQLPHATLAQLQAHHQQQQQQQPHTQQQQRHHLHQSPPPLQQQIPAHLAVGRPYQHQQPIPHQNHHQQRPVSSYYGEYETVNKYQVPSGSAGLAAVSSGIGPMRKASTPSPLKLNGSLGSSGRYQHQHQRL